MSRIGKLPIPLGDKVKVTVESGAVAVTGPKGSLRHALPPGITAKVDEGRLVLERKDDTKQQRAFHGLARALLHNAVQGVTSGFTKELEIHGVGYRAQVSGKAVTFNLGHTHPIEFPIPEGIAITVDRAKVSISGIDRQQVGQVAASIRALRPPDVYKQKGIRYVGETLRKKAGKAGA